MLQLHRRDRESIRRVQRSGVTQRLLEVLFYRNGFFLPRRNQEPSVHSKTGQPCSTWHNQTALYYIVEALVRWMAPIMSFTADEIWNEMHSHLGKFVFTGEWFEGLFGLAGEEPSANRIGLKSKRFVALWTSFLKTLVKRKQSVVHCKLKWLYADDTALAAKINKLEDELRFFVAYHFCSGC